MNTDDDAKEELKEQLVDMVALRLAGHYASVEKLESFLAEQNNMPKDFKAVSNGSCSHFLEVIRLLGVYRQLLDADSVIAEEKAIQTECAQWDDQPHSDNQPTTTSLSPEGEGAVIHDDAKAIIMQILQEGREARQNRDSRDTALEEVEYEEIDMLSTVYLMDLDHQNMADTAQVPELDRQDALQIIAGMRRLNDYVLQEEIKPADNVPMTQYHALWDMGAKAAALLFERTATDLTRAVMQKTPFPLRPEDRPLFVNMPVSGSNSLN